MFKRGEPASTEDRAEKEEMVLEEMQEGSEKFTKTANRKDQEKKKKPNRCTGK